MLHVGASGTFAKQSAAEWASRRCYCADRRPMRFEQLRLATCNSAACARRTHRDRQAHTLQPCCTHGQSLRCMCMHAFCAVIKCSRSTHLIVTMLSKYWFCFTDCTRSTDSRLRAACTSTLAKCRCLFARTSSQQAGHRCRQNTATEWCSAWCCVYKYTSVDGTSVDLCDWRQACSTHHGRCFWRSVLVW